MVNNYTRMQRHLYEVRRQVREAEEQIRRLGANSRNATRIHAAMSRARELLNVNIEKSRGKGIF